MTSIYEALNEFHLANRADGLAVKTIDWYRWLLDGSPHSLTKWLDEDKRCLEAISTGTLREYIVWLRSRRHSRTGEPLTNDTVNDYIRALHRFFAWSAVEYGLPNAMARITYPKTRQQQPKAIELDDLRRMFASCGDDLAGIRNRALMAFLIDTGCRAAGICGLLVDHIDLTERKAIVTEKGNKTRGVVFTSRTADLLERWYGVRQKHSHVFYNLQRMKPLTTNGLRQILAKIAKRAQVTGRVNPHAFRHAFAREYILNGGDLATLTKLMGHNEQSTTTGYYALFTEQEVSDRHERFSPMTQLFTPSGSGVTEIGAKNGNSQKRTR